MIGSGTLTKQIASYLARTGYEALNDDALRATKDHILYTLGTVLAGSSAPGINQALAGARALRAFLNEFWVGPVTLIFGAMSDKDIDRMASKLFDVARTVVLTRVRDSRAADGARLGKSALNSSRNVIFTETVRQALSWARSVTPPDGLVCVAGSLHLVGEVKKLLEEADAQTAAM